jgi:hypothetical protein
LLEITAGGLESMRMKSIQITPTPAKSKEVRTFVKLWPVVGNCEGSMPKHFAKGKNVMAPID